MKLHIIGSGPAGLSAARTALALGAQVALIDDSIDPGGQIWRGGPARWADARAHALWTQLQADPNFEHIGATRVVGPAAARLLLVEQGRTGQTIRWERLIICSGARELLLPFPGWTLPGVLGAGGLQALIKEGMPVRGQDIVIAGSGPLLLAAAATALDAGARIKAIVEHRPPGQLARFAAALALHHPAKCRQAAALGWKLRQVPYIKGAQIIEASGKERVQGVTIRRGSMDMYSDMHIDCGLLATGFGLVPNADLGRSLGCGLEDGAIAVDAQQHTSEPAIWAAGECTGIGGVDKSLAEGRLAAFGALGVAPARRDLRARQRSHHFGALLAHAFAPAPALKAMCRPDTIVCRCEDVTAARLAQFADGRDAKLKTRVGMGACQGKTCGAACGFLFGWAPPAASLPVTPATAATLAEAG